MITYAETVQELITVLVRAEAAERKVEELSNENKKLKEELSALKEVTENVSN